MIDLKMLLIFYEYNFARMFYKILLYEGIFYETKNLTFIYCVDLEKKKPKIISV